MCYATIGTKEVITTTVLIYESGSKNTTTTTHKNAMLPNGVSVAPPGGAGNADDAACAKSQ